MAVLGVGMGLMISQLGNVIQSSVEESGRSEAGGLQFTGQQLGSALGVAFIGAIVLIGLTNTFISTDRSRTRASAPRCRPRSVWPPAPASTSSRPTRSGAADEGRPRRGHHRRAGRRLQKAQLRSLKAGLLAAALLALLALAFTRELPHDPPAGRRKEGDPELSPSPA